MMIEENIVDNNNVKLSVFLNKVLHLDPKTNLDIATAFFNVEGFSLVKEKLKGVTKFRLLLGKTPELTDNNQTLGKVLLKEINKDIECLDLTKEKHDHVSELINFLDKVNVEVRIFDKNFLHGKGYFFNSVAVIGSSNFTYAGLTREGELNAVISGKDVVGVHRENWFNKFWKESLDFKDELITLLKNSRFGTKDYSPFLIYIKSLFELQKDELAAEHEEEEKKREKTIVSNVELTEFQDDAIQRVFSRLKKYGAVIVADSVGLGKTYIALKVLEEFGFFRRRRCLVICPAQLKDTMWLPELKGKMLSENILSQENLAAKDFMDKAKRATGGHLEEVELIIVDESHNFRNQLSNRWENLNTLIEFITKEKGEKPKILFMTATPINNSIWDLYSQILLLVGNNNATFIKENIPDLFVHFKEIDKKGNPTLLNDLLNEISIRRTRDYIRKEYPNATVNGKRIKFPERKLETINYKLKETYKGMYKEIAEIISQNLTMAYYNILRYKKEELQTQEEILTLNRMIAIGGIFKTILLKRLESSIEAFRISVKRHINFLNTMMSYLEKGKLLSKQAYTKFIKYVLSTDDSEEDPEEIEKEILTQLEKFNLKNYNKEDLFKDIKIDIKLLKIILDKIKDLTPDKDAKLLVFKDKLLKLHKKSQIVVFTYYKDTLNYVYNYLSKQKEFKNINLQNISGSGSFTPKERQKIIEKFKNKEIDILLSTDVLSEGQNLQTAQILINYDLHWNPTRMIQRAGRIDRIGSVYDKIYIYNFFPEDELEELLRLVNILQNKIINIDKSVGLDQTVLGEKIHPKVFGIIRRLKDKESSVLDELEADVFGGGEVFYQPLKTYLKKSSMKELESLPDGIHSGLIKKGIRGIFFYYKYEKDFHFWYLYDLELRKPIKNKTEILQFISCKETEKRAIPNFFEEVYDINKIIQKDIEETYKNIESKEKIDTQQVFWTKEKSKKFLISLVKEIDQELEDYLLDFPEDNALEKEWDKTKEKLVGINLTKKRLQILRGIWKGYKNSPNWKKLIKDVTNFVSDKLVYEKESLDEFDEKKLRLIALDFIS
ncbi:MAG: hypothetical protein KKB39_03515 [Nanoarchaeota archaeon]|nr:hypothetical protein [Nanoarchaeota archaeon]